MSIFKPRKGSKQKLIRHESRSKLDLQQLEENVESAALQRIQLGLVFGRL